MYWKRKKSSFKIQDLASATFLIFYLYDKLGNMFYWCFLKHRLDILSVYILFKIYKQSEEKVLRFIYWITAIYLLTMINYFHLILLSCFVLRKMSTFRKPSSKCRIYLCASHTTNFYKALYYKMCFRNIFLVSILLSKWNAASCIEFNIG